MEARNYKKEYKKEHHNRQTTKSSKLGAIKALNISIYDSLFVFRTCEIAGNHTNGFCVC